MENRNENTDKLAIKLKVLESKIQKLSEITDQVMNEVDTEYRRQIEELQRKKEAIQVKMNKLSQIKENKSS